MPASRVGWATGGRALGRADVAGQAARPAGKSTAARQAGKSTAARPAGEPPAARPAGEPPAARRGRGPRADPVRRAVCDVLIAVAARGAYANLMLPSVLRWKEGKVVAGKGGIFGDGTAQYDEFWS